MLSQFPRRFFEFDAWIGQAGLSQAEVARRLDYPKATLNRLVLGQVKRIDPVLARRVAALTENAVGPAAFAAFSGRLADALDRRAA